MNEEILEKEKENAFPESGFDKSYSKMTKFLKSSPSQEQLQIFLKENPKLIIFVSKEEAEADQKKFLEQRGKETTLQRLYEVPELEKK